MMIDVHHLASFLAIFDTGSVTAAAEVVGLQQPTVSLHLRALRRQLGDPLFVRNSGRMVPTPRAKTLVDPARDILERIGRLAEPEPSFDAASSDRLFRLAMTDASQMTLLPTILNHFSENAPNLSIGVELIGEGLAADLVAGRIDLALGYVPWLEDCRQQALYSQDWVCLRQKSAAPLDRAAYEAADHVTVASGTGAQLLDRSLSRAGISRQVRLVLPGFLGLAPVIGGRDYLATIPRHTATMLTGQDDRLEICDLPFAAERFRVAQYWHERFDRDPAIGWLRNVFQTLFSRGAGQLPI